MRIFVTQSTLRIAELLIGATLADHSGAAAGFLVGDVRSTSELEGHGGELDGGFGTLISL
ncbi:hypothetical protein JNUCC0626_47285 [Lentzea sp. JNUCC 0626]|uniref:hypothetical protein n=1 Tax=Lentzea sp. JNUCC 0626 TaxID=3367513 RepID=UPI00374A5D6A